MSAQVRDRKGCGWVARPHTPRPVPAAPLSARLIIAAPVQADEEAERLAARVVVGGEVCHERFYPVRESLERVGPEPHPESAELLDVAVGSFLELLAERVDHREHGGRAVTDVERPRLPGGPVRALRRPPRASPVRLWCDESRRDEHPNVVEHGPRVAPETLCHFLVC